jgi:nucleotide-binding universal stress UspA family protein
VAGEFRLIHVGNPGTAPRMGLTEEAGWSYEIIVRQGDVVDQILEEEAHWRPDLMVLATQGHMDFLDALRGSTTERVLRGAHCPVLAVPAMTK